MKTRYLTHWLTVLGGGLLLSVAGLGWARSPLGQGGMPKALADCEAELAACLEEPCIVFLGDGQTGRRLLGLLVVH